MTNPANTPKAVREALCAAQAALNEHARRGMDVDTTPHRIRQLGALIERIDEFRPLGPDGKHGDQHTSFCGCEGHTRPWAIVLFPADQGAETVTNLANDPATDPIGTVRVHWKDNEKRPDARRRIKLPTAHEPGHY